MTSEVSLQGEEMGENSPGVPPSNGLIETPQEISKRRSKNRVNARRSRERKRVMLDGLQQEHWHFHHENKRIKMENENLRETIQAIKTALAHGNVQITAEGSSPPFMINNTDRAPSSLASSPALGICENQTKTVFGMDLNNFGQNEENMEQPKDEQGSPSFRLQNKTSWELQSQQTMSHQATMPSIPLEQLGLLQAIYTNPLLAQLLLVEAAASTSPFQPNFRGSVNPSLDPHSAMLLMNYNQVLIPDQNRSESSTFHVPIPSQGVSGANGSIHGTIPSMPKAQSFQTNQPVDQGSNQIALLIPRSSPAQTVTGGENKQLAGLSDSSRNGLTTLVEAIRSRNSF